MSTINLTNEDNMKLMERYPDKYFDLAIVDPPYGININNNMGRRKGDKPSDYKKVTWDNCIPTADYFKELFRVSKNQIIWGGNYMTNYLPPSPCWLIWFKGFSDKMTFSQFEMAWTSFTSSSKKFDKSPNQQERIHPTQKPAALYRWILEKYAKTGDKILDTHLGSGSIAITCHDLGFDLTACELDKDYFETATKRLKDYQAQITIFDLERMAV